MPSLSDPSADEFHGREYDWLAIDSLGHVALFSTAGAGFTPPEFRRDPEEHARAIAALLALPRNTRALSFPDIGAGLTNTWRLVAERGLFAYDCDPNGGPYLRVATPESAVLISDLPREAQEVASLIRFSGPFGALGSVTEATTREDT